MRSRLLSLQIVALLPALALGSQAGLAVIGEQVVGVARIVDYPQFHQRIGEHPIAEVLGSDAFQPFRAELLEAGVGGLAEWKDPDWQPLGSFTKLAQREVIAIVTRRADHALDYTVVMETIAPQMQVQQIITGAINELLANGATQESERIESFWQCRQLHYRQYYIHVGWTRPVELNMQTSSNGPIKETETPDQLNRNDDFQEPTDSSLVNNDCPTIVCISSNSNIIVHLLDAASTTQKQWLDLRQNAEHSNPTSEDNSPALRATTPSMLELLVGSMTNIRLPSVPSGGEVGWYWNPKNLPLREIDSKPAISNLRPQNAERTRWWDGIQGMQGTIVWPPGTTTIIGDVLVKMEGPRDQGLFQLFANSGIPDKDNFLPFDRAAHCAMMSWNMSEVVVKLGEMYDQVTETPGAFKQTLAATKEELGVDIERDLFSILGPTAQLVGLSNDTSEQNIKPRIETVFLLDIQQPETNSERISKVLQRLFAEDPESRAQKIDGQRYPLWRIKWDFDARQSAVTEAGVMVVDNQFWCSRQADALVQLLDDVKNRDSARFNRHTEDQIQPLQQLVNSPGRYEPSRTESPEPNQNPVLVGVLHLEQSLIAAYNQFKGKALSGPNVSPTIASELFATMIDLDDRFAKVDFSKLPEYAQLGSQLGHLLVIVLPHSEGWIVKFQHQPDLNRGGMNAISSE